MSIDADLAAYYARIAQQYAPLPDPNDAVARRQRFAELSGHAPQPQLPHIQITEMTIPLPGRTLRARLYRPARKRPPLLVYFHGGGWVVGDVDTHHSLCALAAADADVAVISVDYRLAPEHPFPAPCDDAHAALLWCAEQRVRLGLATDALVAGGDSAGGHLAAQACASVNAAVPGLVTHQWLIYPVARPHLDTPSYIANANGIGLTREDMRWYWEKFLDGAQAPQDDTRVDLLAAPPSHVLPPTIVLVAEHDPLHDDGVAYAHFVEQHGGRAELIKAPGMTHGFARLQSLSPAGRRIMHEAATRLRHWLA